jgi:hypothetical protein
MIIPQDRIVRKYLALYLGAIVMLSWVLSVVMPSISVFFAIILAPMITAAKFVSDEGREMRSDEIDVISFFASAGSLALVTLYIILSGQASFEVWAWFMFLLAPAFGVIIWGSAMLVLSQFPRFLPTSLKAKRASQDNGDDSLFEK